MDLFRRSALGMMICLGIAPEALAASSPTNSRATSAPEKGPSHLATWINDRESSIDRVIVTLAQKRADASDSQPLLELQIDLRIIQRDFLAKAALTDSTTQQADLLLRQMQLAGAAARLDDYLVRTPINLSDAQLGLLKTLHEATYHLDQFVTARETDELCEKVGVVILNLSGQTDLKSVPFMRPRPAPAASQPSSGVQETHHRSLHENAQAARAAAVSPSLHRQLTLLADAAESTANDHSGATPSSQTLSDAVTLLEGLGDLPLPAAARGEVISTLTNGLILYNDTRTRSAGVEMLRQLSAFRDAVTRISQLSLSKDLANSLAPAMAWAVQNGQDGAAVINDVSLYLDQLAHFEAMSHAPALSGSLAKTVSDLDQAFTKARAAFVADAANLDHPQAFISGPQQLAADAAELTRIVDDKTAILKIPAAVDLLESYKPRPAAGIEHRASAAAVILASTAKSANRSDARQFLDDLAMLADVARSLKSIHFDALPSNMAEAYSPVALARFEGRWRLLLVEQAGNLASGAPLDSMKLARLNIAGDLCLALSQAAASQTAIDQNQALSHWADWAINSQDIQGVMDPYDTAMAGAVAAYGTDDAIIEKWTRLRRRYVPLVQLLSDAAAYTTACAALPTGIPGDGAILMTPLDHAPFSAYRVLSTELTMWSYDVAQKDAIDAQEDLNGLLHDLGRLQ